MKILFICSSLEPHRDGMGDYTRKLVEGLNENGCEATAISFHDRHITAETEGDQGIKNLPVSFIRLPANLNPKKRLTRLSEIISSFNPSWIVIQYVSFGYHKYGLPLELLELNTVVPKAKIVIMFQELWCGMSPLSNIKERLLGIVQKWFIKLLIKKIRPARVFTNTTAYLDALAKMEIQADLVPVFGNISTKESVDANNEGKELINTIFNSHLQKSEWLILGFFGAIYPAKGLNELIKNSAIAAKQIKKRFAVLRIGRKSQELKSIVNSLDENIEYHETGLLSNELVNVAMQYVDCGVATTSAGVLDKSSSSAAWFERGIPILISAYDRNYKKSEMLTKGIIQVIDPSDILYSLDIRDKLSKQDSRFKSTIYLYKSLN